MDFGGRQRKTSGGNLGESRIQTFEDFWPFYLREHSKSNTRLMHFLGSTSALIFLGMFFVLGHGGFLLAALFSGYGFVWVAHFKIEHNKPATFKYPFWSFISDWKMWWYALTGKLDGELQKFGIEG